MDYDEEDYDEELFIKRYNEMERLFPTLKFCSDEKRRLEPEMWLRHRQRQGMKNQRSVPR